MTTSILGLNHGEINSSAALIQGGKLIAGCPEERFNRQKRTKAFPAESIAFCLQQGKIGLADCAAIAQAWNPGAAWQKFNPMVSASRTGREQYFYAIPDNLFNISERKPSDWLKMELAPESGLPPIYYVQHHRSHAANAFFLSPFEEAAILTCDWRGEFESTTMCYGQGNEIEVLQTQSIPNSLGMFYGTFTEFLGYHPDSDEWKVMALSAFDVDCREYESRIRDTVRLTDDGLFELDQSYYKGAILDQPRTYTDKFVEMLGGREGVAGEEAGEWHHAIAKAMQNVAEDIAVHFLNHLQRLTQSKRVTVSGGFFMNSVFNGHILDKTAFEEMYVSFAPADVGNSIGAALYVNHCLLGNDRVFEHAKSAIGPSFTEIDIEKSLIRRGVPYTRSDNITTDIVGHLVDGKIVALFQGPMEFGERALGHRSILADPRKSEIKDKINASIKYREAYRPFAPAVLLEEASTYFEIPDGFTASYMEKVVPVRPALRDQLQAITHVDGSGRVQTVTESEYPFFHSLLKEMGRRTEIPIILNTSFNINGEPIVLSPDDAISTFYNSGLDVLVLENFILKK